MFVATPLTRVDGLVGVLFFAVGGVIAVVFLEHIGTTFFYQSQMGAIVMSACGHPFAEPVTIPPPLYDFLFMKTRELDCTQISDLAQASTIGDMTRAHLYLASSVVWLWRHLGISYGSLAALLAVLHGAYAAGCYVLGRLFLGRAFACVMAIVLTLSPVAVSMLFYMRDYAKAPFSIWGLVFLFLALRQRRPSRVLALSLCLGVTIGIGAGFRSDVATILFPVALVVLVLGLPRELKVSARLGAIAFFALVVLALTAPLRNDAFPGGSGLLLMEGATKPFNSYLGLKEPPYDLGTQYADELVYASVSSDLRGADPESYDSKEGTRFGKLSQAVSQSTPYLLHWLPYFSADVATRAIKSALLLSGYYHAFAPERRALDPFPAPYATLRAGAVLSDFSVAALTFASATWMTTVFGLAGLVLLIFRIYLRSGREAFWVAMVLLALASYPGIQFSSRHFFHLEFIVWLGIGSLLTLLLEPWHWRTHGRYFALWSGMTFAAVSLIYAVLLGAQDHVLQNRVRQLLEGPQNPVETTKEEAAPGRTLISVQTPTENLALVNGAPDTLLLPDIQTIPPFSVRSASQRLLVEIGRGPGCEPGPLSLELAYRARPGLWEPLQRSVMIAVPADAAQVSVFIGSVFYRPTQSFSGFELDSKQASCVKAIRRLVAASPLPAIFSIRLSPGWERARFHLSLW